MRSSFLAIILMIALSACGSLPGRSLSASSSKAAVKGEALAKTVFEGGDLQNARFLYEKLARKHAGTARLWQQLGIITYQLGDYHAALEAFGNHQKIEKNSCKSLTGIGKSHLRLGKEATARHYLSKCLQNEPDNQNALRHLAIALDLMGLFDQSVPLYKRALSLSPEDPVLRNNFALSLLLDGKAREAVRELSVIAFRSNSTTAMRQNLALSYFLTGDELASRQVLALDLTTAEMRRNIEYFRLLRADKNRAKLRQFLLGGAGA
ncbi:MAG: tetratricopeptide repeat protein [Sneathiellales bacterium]|nr:tetratricopeptide repeat protein [Sneathiellales bacterium]